MGERRDTAPFGFNRRIRSRQKHRHAGLLRKLGEAAPRGRGHRRANSIFDELRGQNPAETDPVSFLSAWASRYGLQPKQVYNVIRAGEAIVIFEGFDELRNAGRAYDRHEHFNALWRMAFPGTKILFTGRPNFFIDQKEKNRTLRTDAAKGAAGNAYTELWELDKLTREEVASVARGFGAGLGDAILAAATTNAPFFEIVSRPSMLPVVATIWDEIQSLREQGYSLTSAILLEPYLQAMYRRKESEIEKDQHVHGAPLGASYLLLPREARELFTLSVVWKMADIGARNTIARSTFDAVIGQTYVTVMALLQKDRVPAGIVQAIRAFEERFRDETKADRLERISNEIASAGLFVPDPAGGPSNLQLPHKQFYEYMIAKAAWISLAHKETETAALFNSIVRQKGVFENLLSEELSLQFFSEMMGAKFAILKNRLLQIYLAISILSQGILVSFYKLLNISRRKKGLPRYLRYNPRLDSYERTKVLPLSTSFVLATAGMAVAAVSLTSVSVMFSWANERPGLGISLTAAFFVPLSASTVGLLAINTYSTYPRIAVLRRIVSKRLGLIHKVSARRISLIAIHRECLAVISDAKKSVILRDAQPGSAAAQHDWQNIVAPVA